MAREVLTLGQVRIHSGSATREEAMKEAADILEAAGAVHISVDNFMNSPRYDEVVELVVDQHKDGV